MMRSRGAVATVLVAIGLLGTTPLAAQSLATETRTIRIERPVQLTVETYKLDNGLNVVMAQDRTVPVVAVNLWYHVGSANEDPGRTGFAHLFEHLMFQGSRNVAEDEHFRLVQEAGGSINGSTSPDRTNYYQAVPSNFLERVLWQEADRMGFLLPAMTQGKLDNQRSVVQNERRQRIDNAPYGLVGETIAGALYPADHPYSWSVIGSMEDLNAASMEDVEQFFRRYYAPNNASLAIVGDFDPGQVRLWIERYFGDIPAGPPIQRPNPPRVVLTEERRLVLEDRVQLPQLNVAWPTVADFQPGDADLRVLGAILGWGRGSRLVQRLVVEEQIAQNVSAGQGSRQIAETFSVVAQARPGVELPRVLRIVDEEIARLAAEGPTEREVQRARNAIEASLIEGMQTNLNRADILNRFAVFRDDPGFIEQEIARYDQVTPETVREVARRYLRGPRVVLSVIPRGQTHLQVAP